MRTVLLLSLCFFLGGCVSVTAKACFGVPQALRSVVPAKVPTDGCPVDFHYSNMEDPAKQ